MDAAPLTREPLVAVVVDGGAGAPAVVQVVVRVPLVRVHLRAWRRHAQHHRLVVLMLAAWLGFAGYRHPSPRSTDCAQCHRPPRSHTMEHFGMISQPVAGHREARVDQCHLCHQTTAWNDVRGVGWFECH